MEISEAVKIAEQNPNVQEHIRKGFYLSSAMALPETLTEIPVWILVYFHPETKKVFSVETQPGFVVKNTPSDPLIQDHYSKLCYADALKSRELLSKLVNILAEQKEVPTKVIIILRDEEWKIAIVTQSLRILRIDMDMKTGRLKNIVKSSLVKTV